jgi:PAS domain S-box-containing protein
MKRHSKGGAPTKAPRRKTAMPKRRNAPKAARRRGSSAAGLKAKAAQLTRELRESLQQQKATAEVLRIISLSHGELQPIFQAVLENATRICDAKFGNLLRFDGNALHLAAWLGTPPEFLEFQRRRGPFQPPPGGHLDRAVRTKQVSHSADEAAEAGPSPATMLGGARSIVSVPLLNDDVLIGVIVIYRQEVRPFTDRQIALVQDFAAQAVIAIENARLHADRLKAEESVRKAEGELRTVIDAIPAMAWSATPDGAADFVNRGWVEYTNLSLEETKGFGWSEAIHPDDRAAFVDRFQKAVAAGKAYEDEGRIRRADGEYRWFLVRGAPLRDETGNVVKWFGTCLDIEERKRAEIERHQAGMESARLASIVASSDFAIISKELDGRVTSWNAAATRIFGYTADEMIGQSITRVIPPELHAEEKEIIAQVKRGELVYNYETVRIAKDGSRIDISVTVAPLRDKSGEVIGASKIARDITERKRAEEALGRARAELTRASRLTTMGELAGSIIHEINQPLAAVVGNAEVCLRWLDRDPPDLAEARDAISRLARDGRRAVDVISGLRALARKSDLALTHVDINDAIREVLALLRGELEHGEVTLRVNLFAADRPVLGDRVQLQQVLVNLIRNGVEAMSAITDRSRVLRISAQPIEAGEALVTVEDAGIGLDPAATDRIFDPLFSTKVNGMGMGLSICRSIVEAHRGRLWASPNLPHGTSFRFSVPFATPEK